MRRAFLLGIALGLGVLLVVLVQRNNAQHSRAETQSKPTSSIPKNAEKPLEPDTTRDPVKMDAVKTPDPSSSSALIPPTLESSGSPFAEKINKMTAEQRIAQQMFSYVPADLNSARVLLKLGLGGIFLNRNHGPNLADYHTFLSAVVGENTNTDIAPLVGIDQEGGKIARVQDVLMRFPSNAHWGSLKLTNALKGVQKQGQTFGEHLRAAGFSVDFAPVVDVASNTKGRVIAALERSYSSDANTVSTLGEAFGLELQKANIAPTFKHFPGHGMVSADSHRELARTGLNRHQLEPHLAPYRSLLANPTLQQDQMLVMTSHVLYPALDPYNPASLSHTITTDLLRGELHYQGVVITDALGMKALTGTLYSRVRRALAAGADMALIDPGLEQQVPHIVRDLAQEYGNNPELWKQNAAALERIFRLKQRLGLLESPTTPTREENR